MNIVVGIETPSVIARLISAVAFFASAAFVIAPPTMITEAPRLHCPRRVLGVQPSGHGNRNIHRRGHGLQQRERVTRVPAHLLVNRDVHVQHVHAQRRDLLCPRHRIGCSQQVGHDLRPVLSPRRHTFA